MKAGGGDVLPPPDFEVNMHPLLSIRDLNICFTSRFSQTTAVHSIDLDIHAGETLGVAGESGSGKSVTALAVMGLIRKSGGTIAGGSIVFRRAAKATVDLCTAGESVLRSIRGNEIAMIFQEPMTSLNPVFTVGDQIREALITHKRVSPGEAEARVLEVMDQVRIPEAERRLNQYPHELSGGMRQRVMIAIALVCRPKLLIADEPTTALDVTIQAQILWLLKKLQEETGAALMFITHDLGIMAQIAERVAVMSNGRVVETGTVAQIFAAPAKPYTKNLLAAVPVLGTRISEHDAGSPNDAGKEPLLILKDLSIRFPIKAHFLSRARKELLAVDRVSLQIEKGRTLGLVGESGCGKSTICKAIVGLVRPSSGNISIDGIMVNTASAKQPLSVRRKIQIIFQDPMAALSPRRSAFSQIAEPLFIHRYGTSRKIRARVEWLTERVGLEKEHLERYPHEFSGGQRQRVCIARALALNPALVIADEPVSALDVSIQAKVLDLLQEIQKELGIAYLFISHDMAVIEKMSDDIAVMHRGRIIEYGARESVLGNPVHPYTRNLLQAVPVPDPTVVFRPPRFYDEGRESPIVSDATRKLEPIQYLRTSDRHFVALEAGG
jgi:ABC-type glutathione transport system ATPase component